MPMTAVLGATPYYVLMDENCRIGPSVVPLQTGTKCLAIYGFSDKELYDTFCSNSELELQPYPLVKGYLRSQVDSPDDGLKLVVFDAAGTRDACLYAATMDAVLEAQENRMTHVTATYQLMFDQAAQAYAIQKLVV